MNPERHRDFILANTELQAPPHVPELRLHLAHEAHDLWHKTERELEAVGVPPPFWAFAWAGGQGLARYILDHPQTVAGKQVLDFATGSGLVAIAAARAGAASVTATEIDPFSISAATLNAEANDVSFTVTQEDLIGRQVNFDVLLTGDVFYEKPMADRLIPWFDALIQQGVDIIVGDPGRTYCPRNGLEALAHYAVPVSRILEDSEIKHTSIYRFTGSNASY